MPINTFEKALRAKACAGSNFILLNGELQPMLIPEHAAKNDPFYSSAVIEHIVPKAKALDFQQWLQNLICHAQQFEGFVNAHIPAPLVCKNDSLKWCLTMHFDSAMHLNAWLTAHNR